MISLRKIEPSDLPYLYQWENDADAWSDGSTHNPLSQKDLRDYIGSSTGDLYRDGQLRLVAQDDDAMIGCIDLFDLDIRNRRAAIGMYVAKDLRRNGYGQQMVQLIEQYAFDFLHLRVLYAVISEQNTVCWKIYEKMGYQPSSLLSNWTLEGDARMWIKQSNY